MTPVVPGIDPVNTRQAVEPTAQRAPGADAVEPRLPPGKAFRTVQPYPLPMIAQAPEPHPVHDERTQRLQVAQARAELTGIGGIVDTIV